MIQIYLLHIYSFFIHFGHGQGKMPKEKFQARVNLLPKKGAIGHAISNIFATVHSHNIHEKVKKNMES